MPGTELWLSLSLLPVEPVAVFAVLLVESGSLLSLGLKLELAGTAGSDKYKASSEQAGTAGCIAIAESVFTIDSFLGNIAGTAVCTAGCTAISGLEISVGCEDLAVVIIM